MGAGHGGRGCASCFDWCVRDSQLSLCQVLVQWCAPIVPATQETEAGGFLEPRSSRPAWASQQEPVLKIKIKSLTPLHFRLQGCGPGTAPEGADADAQLPHHCGTRGGHSGDLWGLEGES